MPIIIENQNKKINLEEIEKMTFDRFQKLVARYIVKGYDGIKDELNVIAVKKEDNSAFVSPKDDLFKAIRLTTSDVNGKDDSKTNDFSKKWYDYYSIEEKYK